jgi:hypothetical protein
MWRRKEREKKRMFSLESIKKVGQLNIIGGIVALVLGTGLWLVLLTKDNPVEVLTNAAVTFIAFGAGWYFLRTLLTSQILLNLHKGLNWNKSEITRLPEPYNKPPIRNGIALMSYERTRIIITVLAVLGLTYFLIDLVGISLGGFAGGWLAGSGLAKLTFTAKLTKEQVKVERIYYFSEVDLGPYTEVSYYSATEPVITKPVEEKPDFAPKRLAEIKRPVRTSAKIKAQPLTPPDIKRDRNKE